MHAGDGSDIAIIFHWSDGGCAPGYEFDSDERQRYPNIFVEVSGTIEYTGTVEYTEEDPIQVATATPVRMDPYVTAPAPTVMREPYVTTEIPMATAYIYPN